MKENQRLFEVKYNILGIIKIFRIVSETIEGALSTGHKLCSLSVGREYQENALNGVYMRSFTVTDIDHIVLEKEK